jgi:hypothetical protein
MKPFLVITGMHRSGTSFLARAFNLYGVHLGDLDSLHSHEWRHYNDNPRGHWENKDFFDLAEKTLTLCNGSWDQIPKNISVDNEMGQHISKSAKKLTEFPSICSGFKDPRIIFLLESWMPYLPENIIIVGIFRDPLKVAESLKKRNQFDYSKSLNLWKSYNEELLKLLEKHQGFLLDFDWSQDKLFSEIDFISEKIGLAKNIDLSKWYDLKLIHGKDADKGYPLSDEIKNLYEKLQKRSQQNNLVQITINQTPSQLRDALGGLLTELQNNGQYFKKIFEQYEDSIKQSNVTIVTLKEKMNYEIKTRDQKISHLESEADALRHNNYEIGQTLSKTMQELNLIKNSVIFTKMRTMAKIFDNVAPPNTTRSKILKKMFGLKT